MLKKIMFILTMSAVMPVHAAISIECGEDVDAGAMTVGKRVLVLSSQDENFLGQASERADGWSMEYRGQKYPAEKATASEKRTDHGEVLAKIEINIHYAMTPIGEVGKRLVIENPYDDIPILIEYKMGGVTGPLETGNYACISTHD